MGIPNNLTFIDITSQESLESFLEWMDKQDVFPFAIFLDGSTFEFKNKIQKLFFTVGFEAATELDIWIK